MRIFKNGNHLLLVSTLAVAVLGLPLLSRTWERGAQAQDVTEPSVQVLQDKKTDDGAAKSVPAVKAVAPAVEKAAPAVKAVAPAAEKAAPAVKAVAPAAEKAAPAVKAVAPAVEKAAPAVKAVAPAVEKAAPAVKAVAPAVEKAAPAVKAVAPAAEKAAPAVKAVAPAAEKAAPAVKAVAPAVEKAAPAVKAVAPAVEKAAPAVKAVAPAVEKAAPAVKAVAPVVEKAAPAVKAVTPTVKELPKRNYGIRLIRKPGAPKGSLLGNYLAGQVARGQRDHDAAARYFAKALEIDPQSSVLLEQTFVLQLARGNWPRSIKLANELTRKGKKQRFSHMVLALQAIIKDDFAKADELFSSAERRSPLGKMIGILVESWMYEAKGKSQKALDNLNRLTVMSWSKFYQDYHRAMIADQAGRHTLARQTYKRMFKKDPRSLRLMEAYVRHLSATGAAKKALKLIATHVRNNGGHPLVVDLQNRLEKGQKLSLIASTPREGLAELYYGIGDALTGDGGVDLGMIYLQAGLKLRPDLPLASMALAEAYEESKHFEQANRIYDKIGKDSPLWPGATVHRAFNLNSLDKVDEAKKSLDELIAAYPNDITAAEAQGNILRAHKRFKEAVVYYTKAINLLPASAQFHWKYYYSRGVCFERLKDWSSAEKDLLHAHKLDPDQALVLNYLGYSWVDQGLYLKKAMRFIRRAVELKPDDGYFVDSLGWAHFRLRNYKKAAIELERAVEIKPDDPVINDHLGDAYWRVGRKLEAQFQWKQSLTLEPEEADALKIREKLKSGLKSPPKPPALAVGPGSPATQIKLKKEVGKNTRFHVVRSGESLWTIAKRYYGKGYFHEKLLRANRNRLLKGNRIKPGLRLIIPPLR